MYRLYLYASIRFAKRTVPYLVDYSYEILYNYIQIRLGSKQENRSSMRDNRNNNRNNINKANNSKSDNGIRINKFLSDAGLCSRREADRYIQEGKVKIDGVKAEIGSRVRPENRVTFKGKPVTNKEKRVLIAFNKPVGIVSTTSSKEPDNIVDFINYPTRIFPIGRLDKESEGLILLTNDGDIVNSILRERYGHDKEYIVTVNKEISKEFVKQMSEGVPILDTVTKPCKVTLIDKNTFRIVLTQGLNRQIRRMCEYLGYRVIRLVRVRIMNINLGRLKPGTWRNLTSKEMEELNRLIEANED